MLCFVLGLGICTWAQTPEEHNAQLAYIQQTTSFSPYTYTNDPAARAQADSAMILVDALLKTDAINKKWLLYAQGNLFSIKGMQSKSIAAYEACIGMDSLFYPAYANLVIVTQFSKYARRATYLSNGVRLLHQQALHDSLDAENWFQLYKLLEMYNSHMFKPKKALTKYAIEKCIELDSSNAVYWWESSFHQPTLAGEQRCLEQAVHFREGYWYRRSLQYFYQYKMKDLNKAEVVLTEGIGKCRDEVGYYNDLRELYEMRSELYKRMKKYAAAKADKTQQLHYENLLKNAR